MSEFFQKSQVALVIAAVSAADVAIAQSLEEVVVTAQRRSQSLQDVPLTVTAMTSDQLTQNSITSFSEIGRISPGVSMANISGEPNQAVGVRGVATRALGVGVEASTGVFIDGVYQRDFVSIASLVDVQQIEVLKGPQGTLFGRNAAAGAINIRTNDPTDELEGNVSVTAGSESLWKVSGVLNLPLGDSVFTRTSVILKERDGWQRDVDTANADDLYEDEAATIRSRLTWLASDTVSLDFGVDYQTSEGTRGGILIEKWGSLIPSAGFERTHDLDDEEASLSGVLIEDGELVPWNADREQDSLGLSMTLTWDMSDSLVLTSTTAFRDSEIDLADSAAGMFSLAQSVLPYAPAYVGFETYDFESINQEFRLSGSGDSVDWFVGFNYFKDESALLSNFALPAFHFAGIGTGEIGDAISDNEVDSESYAIFGDAIISLSESTNLTVGIRYSYDEKKVVYNDVNQKAPETLFADIEHGIVISTGQEAFSENDWDNVSGRVVLDHIVFEDTLIYASVSQGYKAGGFNSQIGPGSDLQQSFDTEESINYEAGWKSSMADGALTLNGAVFFNKYEGYQFQVSTPGGITAQNVGGDAEILGMDFDLNWLVTDAFTLSVSGSFLDAEFVEEVSVTGPGGTEVAVKDGQSMQRAPEFSGLLSADYLWPLNGRSSFRFNLSYFYTDEQRISNTNIDNLQGYGIEFTEDDVSADSYGLLSCRITYTHSNEAWRVSLWGTNLTDESYREGSNIEVSNAVYNEGLSSVVAMKRNEPRMYGVDVQFNF